MAAPPPILITSMNLPCRAACEVTSNKRHALDGMEAGELERGRLRETATDIEGLHRLAGRAFHQVVERGHDHNAVGIGITLEADVAPVGAGEELGFRVAMDTGGFFDEPHEGLVLVGR